jgi:hypothetical protein
LNPTKAPDSFEFFAIEELNHIHLFIRDTKFGSQVVDVLTHRHPAYSPSGFQFSKSEFFPDPFRS